MSLEVKELEVVGTLVPFVLLVVVAGAGQARQLFVNLEALVDSEM